MCDLGGDHETSCSPPGRGAYQRGDLLVCANHASEIPANVGRVEGEVRCPCGYFKPRGTPCGEPCI